MVQRCSKIHRERLRIDQVSILNRTNPFFRSAVILFDDNIYFGYRENDGYVQDSILRCPWFSVNNVINAVCKMSGDLTIVHFC